MSRLEEIKDRVNNITKGPWIMDEQACSIWQKEKHGCFGMKIVDIRGWGHLTGLLNLPYDEALLVQKQNGEFIANAPTDILYLLNLIEEKDKLIFKLEND